MNIVNIKINKAILNHVVGAIVRVPADDAGIPTDKFWRDRLRDADIDNCVEVVPDVSIKNKPNKDKEKS